MRTPRIFSPIKRIMRFFSRNPLKRALSYLKRIGRRQIIAFLVGYLATTISFTYVLTAALTPASFSNPSQVLSVMEKAGLVNTATFGLAAPVTSGVKEMVGNAVGDLGDFIGNRDLAIWGRELAWDGEAFFKEGLGAFSTDGGFVGGADAPLSFDPLRFLGFRNPLDDFENPAGRLSDVDITPPIDNGNVEVEVPSEEPDVGHRWTEWVPSESPNYYRIVEEPVAIDVSVKAGHVVYAGIDELGRTGRVTANIIYDMVSESAGWRAGFAPDADSISGWGHNFKAEIPLYCGGTYNGWFWNRSHLLADSLGGYNHVYREDGSLDKEASLSERRNLITGTRMQNVGTNNVGGSGYGGMAYFERMAVDYMYAHPTCSIWYSAEPLYEGDETIPRSVYIKVKSCDGGLDVQGEVYNTAAGYTIDYRTGVAVENE